MLAHLKINMRDEEIILGRTLCEEAPQVMPAWFWEYSKWDPPKLFEFLKQKT